MVCLIGSGSPSLRMLIVTLVPFGPLMSFTASMRLMSLVEVSSIITILSPARMPARNAGVSSMGAMTVSIPSLIPMVMPMPWNSPWVSICISLYMSGVMKELCGSREVSMPLIAPRTSSCESGSST